MPITRLNSAYARNVPEMVRIFPPKPGVHDDRPPLGLAAKYRPLIQDIIRGGNMRKNLA
jgi:hypothetical protein